MGKEALDVADTLDTRMNWPGPPRGVRYKMTELELLRYVGANRLLSVTLPGGNIAEIISTAPIEMELDKVYASLAANEGKTTFTGELAVLPGGLVLPGSTNKTMEEQREEVKKLNEETPRSGEWRALSVVDTISLFVALHGKVDLGALEGMRWRAAITKTKAYASKTVSIEGGLLKIGDAFNRERAADLGILPVLIQKMR